MLFTCDRFPVGRWPIRAAGRLVWFEDGRADVDDPAAAAALAEAPEAFAITYDAGELAELIGDATGEADDPAPSGPTIVLARPTANASRADWATYATAQHGLEAGSGLKRDEIIAYVKAAEAAGQE